MADSRAKADLAKRKKRKRTVDQTTQYARDVVSGKVVAGEYVVMAAKRHLDDLKNRKAKGLTWSVAKAEKAIRFFPAVLSITEGELEGEPFKLLRWHVFVVGSLFGWLDENGLRRFRFAWLETGKGQAKSPLMAAIGILLFAFSGLNRAEVYCIGEDMNTAKVVFRDAVAMAKAEIPGREGDTLVSLGHLIVRGTGDNAYKLEHIESGSTFKPIANTDSASGPKPIAVLGDEIHEMKKNASIETWRAAIAKKAGDPIMILGTNTPSADQTVGTEYSEQCQKVLRGEFTDDALFAFIARVDPKDDPINDESCWPKALPALGVTFPIENVRKMVGTARNNIATLLSLKRLYFGIPVGSAGFWMEEEAWDNCRGPVDATANRGRRCHLALDLSKRNDLTALSAAWDADEEGQKVEVKTWYWTRDYGLPTRTVEDRIPYRELEEAGELTIIKARTVDYKFVAAQVQQLCATQPGVEQMAVDAAYLADFMDACDEIGFDVWLWEGPDQDEGEGLKIVRHKQGGQIAFPKAAKDGEKDTKTGEEKSAKRDGAFLDMPHSVETLIDLILTERIIVDVGRLNTICAANAVLKPGPFGNDYFDKARSRGRIDGLVTKCMAVGSLNRTTAAKRSVYEERGIRTI